MSPGPSPPPTRPPEPPAREVRLDARGLLCPLPVLLAAREIAKLPAGGRLVVEGDDPGILEDLPAWCAETGHRLVEIGEHAGLVRGVVEAVVETVVAKARRP